jgi:hypothetical protein
VAGVSDDPLDAYLARHFEAIAPDARTARAVDEQELPRPAYADADGTWFVPAGWADRPSDRPDGMSLRAWFEARYAIAADAAGYIVGPDELDDAWASYAAGDAARLLADPTPESMVRMPLLIDKVATLLEGPRADEWRWRSRLRARVEALAHVLREPPPFLADEPDHPWSRFVAEPRRLFREAFEERQPPVE